MDGESDKPMDGINNTDSHRVIPKTLGIVTHIFALIDQVTNDLVRERHEKCLKVSPMNKV